MPPLTPQFRAAAIEESKAISGDELDALHAWVKWQTQGGDEPEQTPTLKRVLVRIEQRVQRVSHSTGDGKGNVQGGRLRGVKTGK